MDVHSALSQFPTSPGVATPGLVVVNNSLEMSPSDWRSLYPFRSREISLDGHRYHYVDEGQGEPLLLVHGNPTWSFFWRELILALRGQYRVIAVDHIGCGLSDKPQQYPYRLQQHIDNLARWFANSICGKSRWWLTIGAAPSDWERRWPRQIGLHGLCCRTPPDSDRHTFRGEFARATHRS